MGQFLVRKQRAKTCFGPNPEHEGNLKFKSLVPLVIEKNIQFILYLEEMRTPFTIILHLQLWGRSIGLGF